MPLSVRDAAEKVGKSKATVHRAIANGLISAIRQPDGSFLIDESELLRVFPPVSETRTVETDLQHHEAAALRREMDAMRAHMATQAATVEDLRRRLDQADAERHQAQEKLTAVLTDQRPRRRWWWR